MFMLNFCYEKSLKTKMLELCTFFLIFVENAENSLLGQRNVPAIFRRHLVQVNHKGPVHMLLV